MKHFTLLILTALFCLSGQAQNMQLPGTLRLNAPMARQGSLSSMRAQNPRMKAPAKAETTEEPISETPAGRLVDNMYVNSESFGLGWGNFYTQSVDGGVAAVVEGTDGFVYVKAPVLQAYVWWLGFPWIKCEKAEGDTIVMKTPQLYAIDHGDAYYVYRMKPKADFSGFEMDKENSDIRFTWKNDTLKQIDECLIGLGDTAGEWFYMGDYDIRYTVNPDKPVMIPEPLPAPATQLSSMDLMINYIPSATNLDSTTIAWINCVVPANADGELAGNTLYFNHWETMLPDAYAMGTVDEATGKLTIPAKQYLGIDPEYNSHVYLLTGNAKVEDDYFNFDKTSEIVLQDIMPESDTIAAAYPASIIINCGRDSLYTIKEYVGPMMIPFEDTEMVPADPIFTMEDITMSTGFDKVTFVLPTVDVNGKILNPNKLYYNLYYNDAVYTFKPEDYKGLSENMTDVPCLFQDSYYDIYSKEGKQIVYFYDKNWEKMGIQSIYRGGGKENRSNIVYVKKNQSGIDNVDADAAVKNVQYFDITGRRIVNPSNGVYIKRVEYTNGTVKAVKIAK